MKKMFISLVVLMLVMALFISGCGKESAQPNPDPPAPTGPTGTITIASVDFSYESTDPIFYESFWGFAMYDRLVTWDEDGKYVPYVAESWEISEDGNTWTFKIREGIKFHNGDPLTAHDVQFSVERFASEQSTNPWSPYLRNNLDYTEVLDDYTFVYHTKTPEPPLIIPFSITRILPKKYFEEVGEEEFRRNPIGSGPWKFVEHVPETSFKMEANTDHWHQVPSYQYVVDLQVPEEMTRISMLRTGEVDIALGISTDRLVDLRDNDGFKTQIIGYPTGWTISFPGTFVTDKPTKDIRFRKAMSYAINRQEICDTFYMGLAVPGGTWFMQPGAYGWDSEWEADPYDPEMAKKLLDEIGYPEKFADPTITYFVAPGPAVDQAQLLLAYWEEVGIDVEVEIIDSVQLGGMIFVRDEDPNKPHNGNMWQWSFPNTHNAIYHSANMFTSKGVHTTSNDTNADALYKKATSELDPGKALQYWTEFREYAHDMYINVGIVLIESNVLVSPELGEFTTGTHRTLYDALSGIAYPK